MHFRLDILATGVRRLTDSEYPALDAGDALLKEAQDKNMGGSLCFRCTLACCCIVFIWPACAAPAWLIVALLVLRHCQYTLGVKIDNICEDATPSSQLICIP